MFDHGQRLTVADNEMVEHPHFDQVQRLLQTLGQQLIRLTGIAVTGRVVVTKDHRRRVIGQATLHHLAGMYAGIVDGAANNGWVFSNKLT